jgi:TPR repeat protein
MSLDKLPMGLPDDERWRQATAALNSNKEAEAVDLLRDLAEQGDWNASTALGAIYESRGPADPSNYTRAAHWYSQALVRGQSLDAHRGLARYYFYGLDGIKDWDLARIHLEQAAPEGDPQAATLLANLCHRSPKKPDDIQKAKQLYAVAANAGYPFAMRELSTIFLSEYRWIKAIRFRCAAIVQLFRLRMINEADARLLGFLPRKR